MSGRPRSLILILAALIAFGPLSVDMYLPSLPTIQREFGTDAAGVQFTLSAYLLGLAVGQMLYGPLSDRIGRKRPLYAGLVTYIVASIGCALAPDIGTLQAMRFLQAIGGCAGMVTSRAVVRDLFDHQEAARVYSILILVMGVAPILAPVAGGQILVLVGWRAIFGGLALFGIACLAASLWILPETRGASARGRRGLYATLSAIGGLARDRLFVGYSLTLGFAMASMHGYFATSPTLFIDVYGLAPTHYAWIFGANAAGFILLSQVNRGFLRRTAADRVLRWASWAQLGIALTLLAVAWTEAGGLWGLVPAIFGVIAILGLVQPNALAGAMMVEPSRAGTASALVGTVQYTICALTAWLSGFIRLPVAMPLAIAVIVTVSASFLLRAVLVRGGRAAQPVR
jgi:DHA1 family bicyclomycin/chloramphenicol resistance-like MFS transporter